MLCSSDPDQGQDGGFDGICAEEEGKFHRRIRINTFINKL